MQNLKHGKEIKISAAYCCCMLACCNAIAILRSIKKSESLFFTETIVNNIELITNELPKAHYCY